MAPFSREQGATGLQAACGQRWWLKWWLWDPNLKADSLQTACRCSLCCRCCVLRMNPEGGVLHNPLGSPQVCVIQWQALYADHGMPHYGGDQHAGGLAAALRF